MEESKIKNDDEIELLEIVETIWSRRKYVIKVTSIFIVLGLIIAFTSKVEYEAYCKLLPESGESLPSLGGLGGLAGLAGFDISNLGGSESLSPEVYPEIVFSTPFIDRLINTPVYYEKLDTTISSLNYFQNIDKPSLLGLIAQYTIGLPGKIIGGKSESDDASPSRSVMARYSKSEWKLFQNFSKRMEIETESATGIILIKVKAPDAVASAQITQKLMDELTSYISNHQTEKAQVNLTFIQSQFDEAKIEYQNQQAKLARYTNRNRNISNPLVQIEYERLQNEMNIAFEVYKGLATQLEQSKIQVNQEKPVFTILEPVRIPDSKSEPKRAIILILATLLGGIVSTGIIVVKFILRK